MASTPIATNIADRVRLATADRLRAYIAVVTALALFSLALPAGSSVGLEQWVPAAILLTVLSTLLEFASVPMPRGGDLSVATITHVAAILLVPMPFSAIAIGISLLVHGAVQRSPRDRLVFNVSSFVLTASIAAAGAGFVGNMWAASATSDHFQLLAVIIMAGALYYIVNTVLINMVIAIALGQPLLFLMRANSENTGLSELGAASVGGLGAVIWTVEPWWTLLLAVPAAVISRSLQYIRQLEQETRSAIRSLAQLVDDRDASTYQHSERVSAYAEALGRELGLPEDEVELVGQAAAVHDLGKIGIPDRILLKAGPLSDEERRAMWLHTEIGARVLGNFQTFRAGTLIVLHHHENYDGTGYPGRLTGDAIPIGARIVAVADAFDAMTSNRPYRPAMALNDALDRLRVGAGTQWDPKVVGAFIKLALDDRLGLDAYDPEHAHTHGHDHDHLVPHDHADATAHADGPRPAHVESAPDALAPASHTVAASPSRAMAPASHAVAPSSQAAAPAPRAVSGDTASERRSEDGDVRGAADGEREDPAGAARLRRRIAAPVAPDYDRWGLEPVVDRHLPRSRRAAGVAAEQLTPTAGRTSTSAR